MKIYCLHYSSPTVRQTRLNRRALTNPRSRVDRLTVVSGGGDGIHDAPEAAVAEEEAEAAGKVAVAAAGAGEIVVVVAVAAAAADGCVG